MILPYFYINIFTGTKACRIIEEAEELVTIMKRAKRPLFVFGPLALNICLYGKPIIHWGVAVAKALNTATVATGHSKKTLLELGIVPDSCYDIVEIINHLKDPNWAGVKKQGNHDLIMFLGIRPDLASQGLSTLKHFARHLRTLPMCPFIYHNASYSLPNLSFEKWAELMESVIKSLGGTIPERVKIVEKKIEIPEKVVEEKIK